MYFRFVSGVTSASELDEMVEELKRGLATPVQTSPESEFGEKLKEAVRRRIQNRRGGFISQASVSDKESFGKKLTAAIEQRLAASRMTPRKARERAEREEARYRRVTRRQPAKGE